MDQSFYTSEELEQILAEMKIHQRKAVLLCIDEILTAIDTASPAGEYWKAARRHIQLIEGKKFVALAGIP